MATQQQKLEAEKKQLGLEQAALEREKNAIKAAQLGSRRAALGRSSEERIGRTGGGGLLSTPRQRQQAKDIGFVERNIRTAEKILEMAESGASPKPNPFGVLNPAFYNGQNAAFASLYGARFSDPLAEEKKQVASARADIQRVNRGQRPLLEKIELPKPQTKTRNPFMGP